MHRLSFLFPGLRRLPRLATGFNPARVTIPKRFMEITTWKGKVDGEFLSGLQSAYARRLWEMAPREDHT